jgi:hypothetical protein
MIKLATALAFPSVLRDALLALLRTRSGGSP